MLRLLVIALLLGVLLRRVMLLPLLRIRLLLLLLRSVLRILLLCVLPVCRLRPVPSRRIHPWLLRLLSTLNVSIEKTSRGVAVTPIFANNSATASSISVSCTVGAGPLFLLPLPPLPPPSLGLPLAGGTGFFVSVGSSSLPSSLDSDEPLDRLGSCCISPLSAPVLLRSSGTPERGQSSRTIIATMPSNATVSTRRAAAPFSP